MNGFIPGAGIPGLAGSSVERLAFGQMLAARDRPGHDLSASDCETLDLAGLLGLARPETAADWANLTLGYADPRGHALLRAGIAGRHRRLEPDDVLCAAGAQEAVTCVLRALLPPGEPAHAVLLLPIYPPSHATLRALAPVTALTLRDADDWQPDLARIEDALRPETRVLLMNFPNSPTGASILPDRLRALAALCATRGIWLVNDEIYRQTDINEAPPMVADLYERGVSINGLSKSFGLPGLRVGWIACRARAMLADALLAKSALSTCLSSVSEVLGRIALEAESVIVGRTRVIGRENTARLQGLIEARPDLFAPEPVRNLAFAFPRVRSIEGADALAARLLGENAISVLPGSAWRTSLGEVPSDRVRIGLGHSACGPALDLLAGVRAGISDERHPRAPARSPADAAGARGPDGAVTSAPAPTKDTVGVSIGTGGGAC